MVVAVGLKVLGIANASVGHDRRATARLIGGRATAVATARTRIPVKGVQRIILMPEFVGHVIYPERVANGCTRASDSPRLLPRAARNAQTRQAATIRAKHMANVIVGIANHTVQIGLVLGYHRARRAVGVGVCARSCVDNGVVIGD